MSNNKKSHFSNSRKNNGYDLSVLQPRLSMDAQNDFSSMTFFDLLHILKRRIHFIIFCIILGIGVSFYFYTITPNVYQSKASFYVSYQNSGILIGRSSEITSRNVDEKFMNTVIALIKSEKVMADTWNALNESPEKKQFIQNIDFSQGILLGCQNILDNLSAKVGGQGDFKKANVIVVTYKSPDSLEAAIVLEEIIKQFDNYFRQKYKQTADVITNTVQKGLEDLEASIKAANEDLQQYINKTPAVYLGDRTNNNYLAKLQELENKQVEIDIEVLGYQNRLKQVNTMIAGRKFEDIPDAEIVSILSASDEEGNFMAKIISIAQGSRQEDMIRSMMATAALNIEVEKTADIYLKMADLGQRYGADSQQIAKLQSQLDELQKIKREKLGISDNAFVTENKLGMFTYPKILEVYINVLEKRVEGLLAKQAEIIGYINKQNEKVREIVQFYETLEMKKLAVLSQQDIRSNMDKKLDELALLKNYGGYQIEIIEPAIELKSPVYPILWFNIFLGILFGTLCGASITIVLDIIDTTFRTPQEVQNRLGIPLLMQIPSVFFQSKYKKNLSSEQGVPVAQLISYYAANSPQNEIFRQLRTIIQTSVLNRNKKILQFTSPYSADGKTFFISNLAITLAQTDLNVLLIDLDLRKPNIHKLFNIDNSLGFNDYLSKKIELSSIIQPTKIKHLSIIPGGKPRKNSAELLATPILKECLDELRPQYDIILIDTPPVLMISDTSIIATNVDHVIYCTRIRKHDRSSAIQGVGILQGVNANILGCIVNCHKKNPVYNEFATPQETDAKYGYGYGYGYGYEQQHRYGRCYGYGAGYGYDYKDSSVNSNNSSSSEPSQMPPPHSTLSSNQ
ncbi:MAG: polysaccharide biosynthesis tyrosine autokinase [Planctomycetia bacterium]|nr:polysaccharide biosynthesis tyrosine autokinase [Planctomycetia bacterium]